MKNNFVCLFYSDFGNKFNRVAEELRIKKTHDGFDTAMIEIKSDDFKNFIQNLAEM